MSSMACATSQTASRKWESASQTVPSSNSYYRDPRRRQMNEPSDRADMMVIDDVELLTRYLNEQLDPERVAIVRRRLQEDVSFRNWAAPLVLAFELPADSDTRPRPPGEIEKHWDRFTKAAGFVHQRRAARKRRF